MAKSNEELGFARVHGITEGCGDAGGSLSACVSVGAKNRVYRAYAYLWRNNQDISREGAKDEICARGESAEKALVILLRRCQDQWQLEEYEGARRATMEIRDSLDEGA